MMKGKTKKQKGFFSKLFKGNESEPQDTRMACVYASPEIMSGKRVSTVVLGTYPDIYAVNPQTGFHKENNLEDTMMRTIYDSPEMIREYVSERTGIQNNQTAQNNKDKLCICGKLVSVGEERCPHCGRSMIDPEETGWFCKNCGKWVPMRERVCPYCGNNMFSERKR